MANNRRRHAPRTILGPVLHFRGVQGDRWRVSAVFARSGEDEPPDLTVDGVHLPVPPRYMAQHGNAGLWRFDFAVPRGPEAHRAGYGFPGGERWYFTVPGKDEPLRLAYVAGGGPPAASEGAAPAQPSPWSHLMSRHRADPFHLLLQGGGQVDARGLRHAARQSPAPAEEAADFLLDLYGRQWRQPERAALHASLPSVMSPAGLDFGEDGAAPLAPDLWAEARRWAALLQLGEPDGPANARHDASFEQVFRVGETGLLTLDLRTQPEAPSMLTPAAWEAMPAWLGRLEGVRHLLVVSPSAPIVPVRRGLGPLPLWPGAFGAGDEPGFEWRRPAHRTEWLRLLRLLGDFAHRSRACVTVLSGLPGIAADIVLRGPDHEIGQIACPPLAQPPAGKAVGDLLARAVRRPEAVTDGLSIAVRTFPESGAAGIAEPGWLSLTFAASGEMDAEWHLGSGPMRLHRRFAAVRPPLS